MILFQWKDILCSKYFRYFHKTSAIVFTITTAITQAKLHPFSDSITKFSLFDYVIYSPGDAHCWQCVSGEE